MFARNRKNPRAADPELDKKSLASLGIVISRDTETNNTSYDFKVTSQDLGHNEVVLRVSAEGAGRHTFTMRSDNLTLNEPGKQEINLTSGDVREAVWHAHVVSPKTPWVAVVIPDGTLSERREVTGSEIRTFLSDTTQGRSKTP